MTTDVEPLIEAPTMQSWKDMLEEIVPPQGLWSEEKYLVLTGERARMVEFTDG